MAQFRVNPVRILFVTSAGLYLMILKLSFNQLEHLKPDRSKSIFDDDSVESTNWVKPWFMVGGVLRPEMFTHHELPPNLLFTPDNDDDRIVQQLMFLPNGYTANQVGDKQETALKRILIFSEIGQFEYKWPTGRDMFVKDKCPVDSCYITHEEADAETADAIVFQRNDYINATLDSFRRPAEQVWIAYLLESPWLNSLTHNFKINWSATYRPDSDIVAPYGKFVPYQLGGDKELFTVARNYTLGKTKKVAWFVSNCFAENNRMEYAMELAKYIQLDIYGDCGNKTCHRWDTSKCFELLNKDYKFYLSFENSNCKHYITEKFFLNGLQNYVVPIVMGARKEDYQRAGPPHSYIHVDDFAGPEALATYLHRLDRDDTLYNEYFRWKGTGEFINTYFWCRICSMLHAPPSPHDYNDFDTWWRGPGTCVRKS